MHQALRTRPRTPQAVFDRVAPYYDTFNALLSLGIDRLWRRRASRALALSAGQRVLDVATGTGALAAQHCARARNLCVVGVDLNRRMLEVAARRVRQRGLKLRLVACDALRLPFPDGSFDAASIAFAIDDMPDREACAHELLRVLRPGGTLALLELSRPEREPLKSLYRAYLRVFSQLRRVRVQGYDHLAEEIWTYRGADATRDLLLSAGFIGYVAESLSFGLCRLHVARRPPPD